MISKIIVFVNIVFLGMIGWNSIRTTPHSVDTLHDINVQNTKICIDGDYNLLHFAEERIVEMKGSHDQFSIQNVDPQKSLLSELINKKENEDLQSVSVYGHYIDSKREGSTVTVVIPAYQQSCFEVTVEDTAAPLQFKMHTTTQFCYSTFIFYCIQILLFIFYPIGFVYELVFVAILLSYITLMTLIQPIQNPMVNKIAIPLLRGCNISFLFFAHAIKPSFNVALYIYQMLLPGLSSLWESGKLYVLTAWKISTFPSRDDLLDWIILHWKECCVSVLLLIVSLYVFYPSRVNYGAEIRLLCVVAMSLALAFISTSGAIRLIGLSIALCICVLKLQELVEKIWKGYKHRMNRSK